MLTVTFHPTEEIHDRYLKFAVIVAQSHGRGVLCRHKQRSTWEIPGGHREADEAIAETARRELWELIRSLKGRVTIILTTHYMEEAQALSDRIGIMKDGCLLATGTVEELNRRTGTDRFENAFISIVKEGAV